MTFDNLQEALAAEIRARLAANRSNGRAMAEALGWSQSTVSRKLTGERNLTTADVAAIASHLGCTPAELLAGAQTRIGDPT